MKLMSETTSEKILDAVWRAYQSAQAAVDILEDVGLAVDGASEDDKNMSVLFRAMTSAEDAILELFGIERRDEASMVLSGMSREERGSEKFPPRIKQALDDMADTDFKNRMLPIPEGAKCHEVTLSMTGGISVYAASPEDATEAAGRLDTEDILMNACWDSPSATDAYRNP